MTPLPSRTLDDDAMADVVALATRTVMSALGGPRPYICYAHHGALALRIDDCFSSDPLYDDSTLQLAAQTPAIFAQLGEATCYVGNASNGVPIHHLPRERALSADYRAKLITMLARALDVEVVVRKHPMQRVHQPGRDGSPGLGAA